MSSNTAAAAGIDPDGFVTISTEQGTLELPVVITEIPDSVVWLPSNSPQSTIRRSLGVDHGGIVTLAPGGAA